MASREQPLTAATFRGVNELVTNELRDRIVSGEFLPGQSLRQRDLAEELGVSREPIKHAIRKLEEEGLLVCPPRRSAMVAPVTKKMVHNVYEVRAALDAVAARGAAVIPDKERTIVADDLNSLLIKAAKVENGDTPRLSELDRLFHLRIYEAADNDVATEFYRARSIMISRVMTVVASSELSDRAWEEHGRIAEAIRAGDAREAGSTAEAHALDAGAWLVQNVAALRNDNEQGAGTDHDA